MHLTVAGPAQYSANCLYTVTLNYSVKSRVQTLRFALTIKQLVCSGVAKLGHTGARALATRGCAPPVQVLLKIISAECTVINRELDAKSAQKC